ncbi:tRNA pseudouridine(13) synthase TruD [Gayadomonas joobiniege]|uniref:tRNA pseudouridine(13) synthase TruD n=1 Tax=Gayadomonas joobiniege TaxID=1234606 RepID=UPI00036BB225|nr:tRNA pseudouridine(13) synthase TruD [Gayadomonas joobiniege]
MNNAYLHGQPTAIGKIRCQNQDFYVEEKIHFDLDGQGEHLWLWVEKNGQNTNFVAKQLARAFNIAPRLVSTSGMKDRHAVTRQWFCLPWPIKKEVPSIQLEGAKIIRYKRHGKKLKTGTHKFNLFKINIKLTEFCETELAERLNRIKVLGVANYFGEQRFGHDGKNLKAVTEMFNGDLVVRDKKLRGIYLSAARSHIFNQILHQRISQDMFKPVSGDVFMLAGSHSYFASDEINKEILERFEQGDILLSGAMVGAGELATHGQIHALESEIINKHATWYQGLVDAGLKQDRRALQLHASEFTWVLDTAQQSLLVSFKLPAGAFATSVLREICIYTDTGGKIEDTIKQ